MPRFYVTELSHYLDSDGDLTGGSAARLARFLTAAVEAATARPPGWTPQTALRCYRLPGRRACAGRIVVRQSEVPPCVEWECPACGAAGRIRGWLRSAWDLRHAARAVALEARISLPLSDAEFTRLVRCEALAVEFPDILARATYRDGRVWIEEPPARLWKLLGVLTCEWSTFTTPAGRSKFDSAVSPFAAALAQHRERSDAAAATSRTLAAAMEERARRALELKKTGDAGNAVCSELESVLGMLRWHAHQAPRESLEVLWGLIEATARREQHLDEVDNMGYLCMELTLVSLETSIEVDGAAVRETWLRLLEAYESDREERFGFLPHVLATVRLARSERRWLRTEVQRQLRRPAAAERTARYERLRDAMRRRARNR